MIFDRNKLFHRRERFRIHDNVKPLTEYASEKIIENLKSIKNTTNKILNINNANGCISHPLKEIYPDVVIYTTQTLSDEEYITDLNKQDFDLIIYSLGLHAINDVNAFLINIRNMLKSDGIFIGNFIGHESLKALRLAMIKAAELRQCHYNHIYPFIKFDQIVQLLQKSGFKEIIADHENINLEYNSPYHLMKAIQRHGESNVMMDFQQHSIDKNMLHNLKEDSVIFKDKINLISFIACKEKCILKL